MPNVTFKNILPAKGANRREINVEVDGKPFGQLWTFMAKGETHPWHAKTLSGEYRAFYSKDGGLTAALDFMTIMAGG